LLQVTFILESEDMVMIHLVTNFHVPRCNNSLFIIIKQKKINIATSSSIFYTL
jgi:hypothetical protein